MGDVQFDLIIKVNDFLESHKRNEWLFFKWGKIYIRKSVRSLNFPCQGLTKCLDIATIEVYPEYQNKGICKNLIKAIHDMNPYEATFIEEVSNDFLKCHLNKNEYSIKNNDHFKFTKHSIGNRKQEISNPWMKKAY